MKSLQKNKGIIITVILLVVAISLYNMFLKPSEMVDDGLVTAEVGADLVKLFDTIQSVTLDRELFSSPLYKNLNDFSSEVASQPVGRTNPFDLIGR